MSNMEVVRLDSGTDEYGNQWVWFQADQEPTDCHICGAMIGHGWLCLWNNETVCSTHIFSTRQGTLLSGWKVV